MPKMFVHASEGTFTAEAGARVAADLTDLGIACERLAHTAKVRGGVWVFFTDHASGGVFRGGRIATTPTVSLVVFALEGGLDDASKRRLIGDATAILAENATAGEAPVPIYIVVHVITEADWRMNGEQVRLAALRTGA